MPQNYSVQQKYVLADGIYTYFFPAMQAKNLHTNAFINYVILFGRTAFFANTASAR